MRLRTPGHPLLYEINTRVWVREVARRRNRNKTSLADVPERVLDELADLGFDAVWLMGVWQVGPAGVRIARADALLRREYTRALPDWRPDDVIGSPYAVQDYRVAPELGGQKGLAHFRRRLARRNIALILDFVPNHTAADHPWVYSHPEFYVSGTAESREREPENYFVAQTAKGPKVLAHGRDPHFPGWTDTAQLDYRQPRLREAVIEVLLMIAGQCDGVRCDMAMLQLEEIFRRTWGAAPGAQPLGEFWAQAIAAVRRQYPGFLFLAEAYWDREPDLQALGFDYTYDKRLYDLLLSGDTCAAVRRHLARDAEFQRRSVRFLENHDEARVAGLLPPARHKAAAVICYAAPGMSLFHEGQLEGRKVRLPVQLRRRPVESPDQEMRTFYRRLLRLLMQPVFRRGHWKLLEPRLQPEGNTPGHQFIAFQWEDYPRASCVCAINYSPEPCQCYLPLDLTALQSSQIQLNDLLRDRTRVCPQDSLINPGLHLDLASYGAEMFAFTPVI